MRGLLRSRSRPERVALPLLAEQAQALQVIALPAGGRGLLLGADEHVLALGRDRRTGRLQLRLGLQQGIQGRVRRAAGRVSARPIQCVKLADDSDARLTLLSQPKCLAATERTKRHLAIDASSQAWCSLYGSTLGSGAAAASGAVPNPRSRRRGCRARATGVRAGPPSHLPRRSRVRPTRSSVLIRLVDRSTALVAREGRDPALPTAART